MAGGAKEVLREWRGRSAAARKPQGAGTVRLSCSAFVCTSRSMLVNLLCFSFAWVSHALINEKRRPKPASLSGWTCLLARWLAQHSPPDGNHRDVKRETDALILAQDVQLLASHDSSIIGPSG